MDQPSTSTSKKRLRKKSKVQNENSDSDLEDLKKVKKRKGPKIKEKDDFEAIKSSKTSKVTKRKLEEMLLVDEGDAKKINEENDDVQVVEEEKIDDCLIKTRWRSDVFTKNDLISIVFDEIALEGLDGITLEALWLRLSIVMGIIVPENSRKLIWDQIKRSNQLEFYELPEERGKLIIFNRFQYVDVVSGHLCDVENVPEDIYPFSPLSDDVSAQLDIYGSCATFNSRILVSEKIKKLILKEAESLGNKLVIVADQNLRNEALGLNETKSITKLFNQQYSLLERIGRSRKLGESSTGNTSLHQFGDSKIMYYLRKVLLKNNLITKQQLCYQKTNKLTSHTIGLLFHLTRFYFHFKTKKLLFIEQIVEMLKKKPNLMMEYVELRAIYGDIWQNAISKMLKASDVRTFINTNLNINYREIYPNATKKEWMGKHQEKKLKVIQLSDPHVNVSNVLKEIGKDDAQKDESSDEEPLCEGFYNKSCYHQIYDVIYESGEEGLTQNQISIKLGLDTYVSRLILKAMEKENMVYGKNAELGFHRVLRYYSYRKKPTNPEKSVTKTTQSEETLNFLSEILEVDKIFLRNNQENEFVGDNTQENLTKLSGEYEFIKKHRKQLRENKYNVRFREDFYQINSLEDEKVKMERILKNEHGHFDMKTSIQNGIIKKIEANLNLETREKSFNEESFNSFQDVYRVDKNEVLIDYNLVEKKIKDNRIKKRQIFLEGHKNKASIKILINYLSIFDVDFRDFIKKVDEFVLDKDVYEKFGDEKINEIDVDDVSLIENFENEEFCGKRYEEVKDFKDQLINEFENENLKFLKNEDFAKNVEENKRGEENVEIIDKNCLNEVELKDVFVENDTKSLKEFNRGDFNELNKNFQVEKFYGETILVNYSIDKKNQIEIIKIFSKMSQKIPTGDKYFNKTFSQRALQRINYILEAVNKKKIITDDSILKNDIKKIELEKGLVGTIDVKTFNRLLEKLIEEGFIRASKLILRKNDSIKSKKIIWLPRVQYEMILDSVCDQMKMPFLNYNTHKKGEITQKGIKSNVCNENEIVGNPKYKKNNNVGKYYGFLPKNCRLKLFHEFIFYLTYLYRGEKIPEKDLPKFIVENNLENCDLYQSEISWKMFIPPPPKYHDRKNGWMLFMDVLFRLPLNIFTKLFNIVYVIPELLQLLNHPIKRYLLISQIPVKLRNACFHRRKHIFSLYESLQLLCYQGLLQFGEQRTRNKEHQYIYLNKNAIIFDTTSSNPGYHQVTQKEYPKITFYLETEEDVENYWNKVWNICLRTRLGNRYSLLHQTITLHRIHSIPEMIQACRLKTIEEVERDDVGYIPGDGRGACGFDSNSWMFVKKNWVGSTVLKETRFDLPPTKPIGVRKKQLDKASIKLKTINKLKQLQVNKSKINLKTSNNKNCGGKIKNKISKKNMIIRKIKPRPPVKKIKRIDDLDSSIKSSGLFTRSRFTEHEDNTLVIISYAINYLFPGFKKRFIAFTVIRDLMHRLCPKNYKKTSTAYNCRLRKFYKFNASENDSNIVNLEADHFVRKYFSKLKEKIMKSKSEMIPQEHLHIALIYLVAYCVDSFEKKNIESKKILDDIGYVDYLEDFDLNRTVFFEPKLGQSALYDEVNNKDDVLIDTVKSVIHASIGIKVDNTIKIIRDDLDKVYQNYSEEILRKAVSSLREHNLIKTSISFSRKTKLFNTETILQSSYLYSYKQVTKFNEKIYLEAYSVLDSLIKSANNRKFDLNSYQEGFGIGFSELQTLTTTKVNIKIDDKQFILDPGITNHDYLIKELYSRYKRLISKKHVENDLNKTDETNLSLLKEDDNTLINLDQLSKSIKNDDFDKVNEKMSDLTFLLTKGLFPELEDEDDRLERLSKHFLTMNPQISFDFCFKNREKIDSIQHNLNQLVKIEKIAQKECVLTQFDQNEFENYKIINFIESKECLGVTGEELKANFGENVSKIIDRLMNLGVIHRFGVKSFRFVHDKYKNDWTIDLQGDNPQKNKLKLFPWLKLNGALNTQVLIDWLLAICSFCISNPVVTFPSLCKRFNFLKPVDIYVLLEYLEIFDCLEIKCYENVKKVVTLDSNPYEVNSVRANCLDHFDDVYIEMNVLAVTKLGAFTSNQDLKEPFETY
nr:general transcription factor 3C polypeptide 1 [Onthophagus taurus]